MTMGMMMIMMIIRMSRSLDHILESSESSSLSTSMDINTRSLTRYRQDTITLLYQLIYSMLLYWIHQHQVPHQIQGGHYLSSLPAYICCYTGYTNAQVPHQIQAGHYHSSLPANICCYTGYTNTRSLTRYRQDTISLLYQLTVYMLLYWVHQHQVPHQIQAGQYHSSPPACRLSYYM